MGCMTLGHRVATAVCWGVLAVSGAWLGSCCPEPGTDCAEVAREPNVSPDSFGTVIPPNIAPLNFRVLEPGQRYVVKIRSDHGRSIRLASGTGVIHIPAGPWKAMLSANKGSKVACDVYVMDKDRRWLRFQTLSNSIAQQAIDDTLVYRLMRPVYSEWNQIGIYQRRLATYEQSLVMDGRSFDNGCLNCHSFAANEPNLLTIGLRSQAHGDATLLVRNGNVTKIGAKWGYTAWHPSGRLAVYSINKVRQFYHAGGAETRDVVDLDSALACYDAGNRKVVCPPPLAEKDRLETYPAWSPDGRYLYYCSAPILWKDRNTVPPENYDQVRYDLRRISYDVDKDEWGPVETVLSAEQTGLSILLPRVSPNGRSLLFCMCRYGCFPVYQPSSDLYMMDLSTGRYVRLAINSEYSESWHSWSSNGHWIAFSSKRQGGFFTRTYLSYVDDDGAACKPFVLPQRDPTVYDRQLETYSVPELVKGPLRIRQSLLARAARSEAAIRVDVPMTGATVQVQRPSPPEERE